MSGPLRHERCRPPDRADDPRMGPAATEVAGERLLDLAFGRIRLAVEERLGGYDHAVDAVAALHGLLLDESFLERVRVVRGAEPFERGELLADRPRKPRGARPDRGAVQEGRARPAPRQAAD